MSDTNAATGGLLVVLGIIVILILGFLAYKTDMFHGRAGNTDIKIEAPKVAVPSPAEAK